MNEYAIFIFIFLCILSTCVCTYLISDTICNSVDLPEYYTFDGTTRGATIMFIGGTHGNEPAGSVVLEQLINKLKSNAIKLKAGKLIIIPRVNKCGLLLGSRYVPYIGDINRKYPNVLTYDDTLYHINRKILEQGKTAQLVVDFHEGWGYYKINPSSVGSTVIPANTADSIKLSKIVVDNLNREIVDETKKFVVLSDTPRIEGTLTNFYDMVKHNYILIETTGQNDIQPLDLRVHQNEVVIKTVLNYFGLV